MYKTKPTHQIRSHSGPSGRFNYDEVKQHLLENRDKQQAILLPINKAERIDTTVIARNIRAALLRRLGPDIPLAIIFDPDVLGFWVWIKNEETNV